MNTAARPPGRRDTWLDPYAIARRRLRWAMEKVAAQARGQLLDVGCGPKPYFELFAGRVSAYVGIDRPSGDHQPIAADVMGDGLSLPFGDQTFDTVLCNEVLEHVPDPAALLTEAFRVTRPDGVLILTAPQTWGLHEEPRDYYRYTKHGLRLLAERAGYRVERIEPTTGTWGTVGQRLGSLIYSLHGRGRPVPIKAVVVGVCVILLWVANALDVLYGRHGDTLDNVMIARRPAAAS